MGDTVRALGLAAALLTLGAWCPHYPSRTALDEGRYASLLAQMQEQAFDDDRVYVLRQTADVTWMSCRQVVSFLPYFQWRQSKLAALEVMVQSITDREDAQWIVAAFPSGDRGRARAILNL